MASGNSGEDVPADQNVSTAAASAGKPKRVRTGCLTCRERHLKCDEAMPVCMNCRKSQRACKRGVRLNFIDTQCQAPPEVAPSDEWSVSFTDESLEIASEYRGGLGRYKTPAVTQADPFDSSMNFDMSATTLPTHPSLAHQPLPPGQAVLPDPQQQHHTPTMNHSLDQASHGLHGASIPSTTPTSGPLLSYDTRAHLMQASEDDERREMINDPNETLYMQVFVEEVGLWMDSMDPAKTVSAPCCSCAFAMLITSSSPASCPSTPWASQC